MKDESKKKHEKGKPNYEKKKKKKDSVVRKTGSVVGFSLINGDKCLL